MPVFTSPGAGLFGQSVNIAYDDVGQGVPIVLIHGFASNRATNWRRPGWYSALEQAGRRVIALDCRGHGESDKPHDRKAYDEGIMARDVINLLDHLGLKMAEVMGYSMGGFVLIRLLMDYPQRFGNAVIGGLGQNYFEPVTVDVDLVAEGLLAHDASAVTDPVARTFRKFAESQGNDLVALAACFRRPRKVVQPADLAAISQRVLVVVGDQDTITGPADGLAAAIPHAKLVVLKDRDHMVAVGDKMFKAAAADFLVSET